MAVRKTMTIEEWRALGAKRFGDDYRHWRFVCPSCHHVASVEDWNSAGAPEGAVAFSCVGRYGGGSGEKTFKQRGGPCDYAGGGLFKLNPITVIDAEGKEHSVFDFAPATDMGL